MSVKIRMKRFGRTNRAHFRINAVDTRASRDGRVIEELGSYDPHAPDDRKVRLNAERTAYWLSVGAQPSETVRTFLKRAGLIDRSGKPVPPEKAASAVTASTVLAPPPAPATATSPAEPEAAPAPPSAPTDETA